MKKPLALLLSAVLVTTVTGCGSETAADPSQTTEKQEQQKEKIVNVYTVQKNSKPILFTSTGIIEAKQDLELAFGTAGKIVSLNAEKGKRVKKGQLLASLDTSYYEKAVEAASGQVTQSTIQRRETLKGASTEAIAQQRLALSGAQQDLNKAKKDYAQGQILLQGGAIAQNDLDQLKQAVDAAERRVKNEQIGLDTLLKGAEPEDIARIDATYKQATSEVARAQQTLRETKITAPFDGTIVEVIPHVGEMTSPGQSVIHLVDLSSVKVALDVTNETITQFKEGEKVTLAGDTGTKTTGTIQFVSPVIDNKTGKYRVEIIAPNPQGEWRGGMIANVQIPRKLRGLVVPIEAVGIQESTRYVLAVENGVVKKRQVEVGQVFDERIEILSGIKEGDKLIAAGLTYYVDGEKVVAKGE
ncbi:efflux RND transporter periplasmic adaptor subunit [Brevibacillus dissolubilis]|uniref:efflux RND transporter periplasmic adaptor subunit n=1 Tax=Brevibacillus dissolubilis TaxID=1844116 RepID=UPI00210019BE|nr:efflux RND transporter periplasmic adaptor subunit [Brevibacillus dissolubilis]